MRACVGACGVYACNHKENKNRTENTEFDLLPVACLKYLAHISTLYCQC